MLQAAGIGFLPLFLVAFLLALLITIWGIFPSIWYELNPPDAGHTAHKPAKHSSSLGVWLDRGFGFMRWGGELLYWTMWVPTVVFVFLNFVSLDWHSLNGAGDNLIAIVGALVAGTVVGVLGFVGRFKNASGGFRTVLRVMLDVDNWLREHPRESNPTARICGRYVSLLRHISEWRDSDASKSRYDAIVIVAHSQGTVITADFLRFPTRRCWPCRAIRSAPPHRA
jgi:hypothetical protein